MLHASGAILRQNELLNRVELVTRSDVIKGLAHRAS